MAHPYREYSEVFFGEEYRVLRGGSWATRTRVATTTFRNWDYPQRRQIFCRHPDRERRMKFVTRCRSIRIASDA